MCGTRSKKDEMQPGATKKKYVCTLKCVFKKNLIFYYSCPFFSKSIKPMDLKFFAQFHGCILYNLIYGFKNFYVNKKN